MAGCFVLLSTISSAASVAMPPPRLCRLLGYQRPSTASITFD